MIQRKATIRNQQGIHCRPAAAIVKAVADRAGRLLVRSEKGEADCRSMMGLLSLCLEWGTEVVLTVEGPDAEQTCRLLVELFETRFDFPPRT